MSKFIKPKKKNSVLLQIKDKWTIVKSKLAFLSFLDPFTYVDLWVMPIVDRYTNRSKTAQFFVNILFAFIFAFLAYSLLSIIFGSSSPLVIVYSASMEPTFFRGDVMALGRVSDSDYFGPEIRILEINNIARTPTKDYATPIYSDSTTMLLEKINFICDGNCLSTIVPDQNGIVVVYPAFNPNSSIHNFPIIHRSIAKIISSDGNFILTKGDNSLTNPTFDSDCGEINTELNLSQNACITLYAVPIDSLQGKAFFRIPLVGCFKLWIVDNLSSLVFTKKLPSDFRGVC